MTTESPTDGPVLLFDGLCNLCNSTVLWVIAHDRRARVRFASLQSTTAQRLLANANLPTPLPDSVVLLDGAGVHTRSTAALRLCMALGFPYALLGALRIVPRPLRDLCYVWIARHRYAWFGTRESCIRPTVELRNRFLDADDPPAAQQPITPTRP